MEVGTHMQENGSSRAMHQRTLEMEAIADIGGVNLGSSLLAGLIAGTFSESNLPNVGESIPTLR